MTTQTITMAPPTKSDTGSMSSEFGTGLLDYSKIWNTKDVASPRGHSSQYASPWAYNSAGKRDKQNIEWSKGQALSHTGPADFSSADVPSAPSPSSASLAPLSTAPTAPSPRSCLRPTTYSSKGSIGWRDTLTSFSPTPPPRSTDSNPRSAEYQPTFDDWLTSAAGRAGEIKSSNMTLHNLQKGGGSANSALQYIYPKDSSSINALDLATQGLRMPVAVIINGQKRYTEYGLSQEGMSILTGHTLDDIERTTDKDLRRRWCEARLKLGDSKVIHEDESDRSRGKEVTIECGHPKSCGKCLCIL